MECCRCLCERQSCGICVSPKSSMRCGGHNCGKQKVVLCYANHPTSKCSAKQQGNTGATSLIPYNTSLVWVHLQTKPCNRVLPTGTGKSPCKDTGEKGECMGT